MNEFQMIEEIKVETKMFKFIDIISVFVIMGFLMLGFLLFHYTSLNDKYGSNLGYTLEKMKLSDKQVFELKSRLFAIEEYLDQIKTV